MPPDALSNDSWDWDPWLEPHNTCLTSSLSTPFGDPPQSYHSSPSQVGLRSEDELPHSHSSTMRPATPYDDSWNWDPWLEPHNTCDTSSSSTPFGSLPQSYHFSHPRVGLQSEDELPHSNSIYSGQPQIAIQQQPPVSLVRSLHDSSTPPQVLAGMQSAHSAYPYSMNSYQSQIPYQQKHSLNDSQVFNNTSSYGSMANAATTQLQGSRDFSISGNPNFMNIGVNNGVNYVTNNGSGANDLERLESFVSFNAQYDSSAQDPERQCHPGTRESALQRMRDWICDPNATECIFWLHGPAGAGKSAIAQTIARSCGRAKVVATFFFYRSDPSRNDGNRLFATLAYQLSISIPAIKQHIVQSLRERPDLLMTDIENQFEHLIVRPFRASGEDASPVQVSSPVIIIDGVDECSDEKLQQRFLRVIGTAVEGRQLPLRFLISSRPEAHIQETIDRFQPTPLRIDLAKLDDANHDIEEYLKDEFSRIASEQGLDPNLWPGQETINDFVYKASGNFIFAATVVKFVGDPDDWAESRLDIVRGLKPRASTSPFALLDELYTEILKRQPGQDFLMTFLALLVGRSSIRSDDRKLYKDDAMLMSVSEKELHRKLRRMRSLLRFESHISVYHRSFFDLQDSSRSAQYHISKRNGMKRYLELIVVSVIRYGDRVIEEPDFHNTGHFRPKFESLLTREILKHEVHEGEWWEALQRLAHFQEKLLTLPTFTSTWKLQSCSRCTFTKILHHLLLHLAYLRASHNAPSFIQAAELPIYKPQGKIKLDPFLVSSELEQHVPQNDLDNYISLLLTGLRKSRLEMSSAAAKIDLLCPILCFDSAEVVTRVRSTLDAQNLVELIDCLINNEFFFRKYGTNVGRQAAQLALRIYAKVPVLPKSLFLKEKGSRHDHIWYPKDEFIVRCQTAFMGRILDHHYVTPVWRTRKHGGFDMIKFVLPRAHGTDESVILWRKRSEPSANRKLRVMLEVAKAIRYFHSIGIVLHHDVDLSDIFLDSHSCAKFRFRGFSVQEINEGFMFYLDPFVRQRLSYESNISSFGCFFYQVYFGVEMTKADRVGFTIHAIVKRPAKPEIREDAWQLTQRCCAERPKDRPTIDEVVREMESWKFG